MGSFGGLQPPWRLAWVELRAPCCASSKLRQRGLIVALPRHAPGAHSTRLIKQHILMPASAGLQRSCSSIGVAFASHGMALGVVVAAGGRSMEAASII